MVVLLLLLLVVLVLLLRVVLLLLLLSPLLLTLRPCSLQAMASSHRHKSRHAENTRGQERNSYQAHGPHRHEAEAGDHDRGSRYLLT